MSSGGPAEHRWPLRGRDDARRSLLDAAEQLILGRGSIVEIVSEAGSGKSFLLEHVVAELRSDDRFDIRMSTGRGQQFGPYGCARSLLGVSGARPAPPGSSVLEAGVEAAAEAVVFDELLAHADRMWSARPSVWIVDDLHLADTGSLAWFRSIAALRPVPVLLVVARRSWSAPPIVSGRRDEPRNDGDAGMAFSLGPLSVDDAIELCHHRFGRAPGEGLLRLIDDAAGSPLLITSLLELAGRSEPNSARSSPPTAPHQGRIGTDDHDLIELPDELDVAMLGGAPTAIAALVASAAGDRQFATAVLAAPANGFDPAEASAIAGVPLADIARLIDDLAASGIVVADDDSHRFRHELYRLAATGLVSTPMLASIHAASARWLIERGEHPLRVAEHLIAAEATGTEAAGWLVDAAQAIVSLDPSAALDLTTHATAMSNTTGGGIDRRLTTVRARALANMGRPREAEALIRLLLPDASRAERSSLHRDLAMVAFTRSSPYETAIEFELAAESCDDERGRARLHAESSFAHLLAGDFDRARDVAAAGSADGERLGDPVTVIAAEMVGSLVALYRNELDRATLLAERLEAMSALRGAEAACVYQPWFSASLIRRMRNEMEHARQLNALGRLRSGEIGLAWMVPAYDALDAYCAFDLGELDDCAAAATASLAAGITDAFGAAIWCEAFLARVALARGEYDEAASLIEQARARIDPERAQLGWDHVAVAAAELAAVRGDHRSGFDELTGAWEVFEALGLASPRLELAVPLARVAGRLGDTDWTSRVADDCALAAVATGHEMWALVADETVATHERDVDALVAVSDLRRAAGHELRALEILVEAARLAGSDDHRDAAPLVSRCLVEVERLGVPGVLHPLAPLLNEHSRSAPRPTERLTKSERAVVALVADGLSNSEIAERLFVSRRTVESHVSAAYRKLGASNRVELARRVLDT